MLLPKTNSGRRDAEALNRLIAMKIGVKILNPSEERLRQTNLYISPCISQGPKDCTRNMMDVNGIYLDKITEFLTTNSEYRFPGLEAEFHQFSAFMHTLANSSRGSALADHRGRIYNPYTNSRIIRYLAGAVYETGGHCPGDFLRTDLQFKEIDISGSAVVAYLVLFRRMAVGNLFAKKLSVHFTKDTYLLAFLAIPAMVNDLRKISLKIDRFRPILDFLVIVQNFLLLEEPPTPEFEQLFLDS